MVTNIRKRVLNILLSIIILLMIGVDPVAILQNAQELDTGQNIRLTDEQIQSLESLVKINNYPLYTMHYYGEYAGAINVSLNPTIHGDVLRHIFPQWGCSLFVSLANPGGLLYGRNFDWNYSPSLLLFTDPHDGYASASMVDLAYLVDNEDVLLLEDQSTGEQPGLLQTPYWPFDGMNEMGLVIGMAAVPGSRMPVNPAAEQIDSLLIMRMILDKAENIDQALEIMARYNITWGEGPALHYLIADQSGSAVLVEFYQGKMVVIPNQNTWHLATNHLRTTAQTEKSGCWRYDLIQSQLTESNGWLNDQQAIDLLSHVSNGDIDFGTQWSVVYDISDLKVHVVVGQAYHQIYSFDLRRYIR